MSWPWRSREPVRTRREAAARIRRQLHEEAQRAREAVDAARVAAERAVLGGLDDIQARRQAAAAAKKGLTPSFFS